MFNLINYLFYKLAFKDNSLRVLCATDVAARGLDISDINVVINFDFPTNIETYIHRIGRTGRVDNKGISYSFYIDTSNYTLTKNLIEVLKESNNEIPEELFNVKRYNVDNDKFKINNKFNNKWKSNRYNSNRSRQRNNYYN